ncbi:hypothetical protein [Acinetobacter calcoaceticus]|uniref:hypothetical protein n=1 Tax=Acinetobacter calcoaceticus TaxID=471 RepID=UPI002275E4FF|nr:hypothetical protein [Acinetobacter calcoaceticus]GLG82177.1 hypothetical protein ACSO1_06990 [Acinetobacter calcoaceticus]
MSILVSYVDVSEDNGHSITVLNKKYPSLSDAYLPKVEEQITVYSTVHHEQYQYRVKEIMVYVAENEDHFYILLDMVN